MIRLGRQLAHDWPTVLLIILLAAFLVTFQWPWMAAFTGCTIAACVRRSIRWQRGRRAFERAQSTVSTSAPSCAPAEVVPLSQPLSHSERAKWLHILVSSYDGPELADLYSPASRRHGGAA